MSAACWSCLSLLRAVLIGGRVSKSWASCENRRLRPASTRHFGSGFSVLTAIPDGPVFPANGRCGSLRFHVKRLRVLDLCWPLHEYGSVDSSHDDLLARGRAIFEQLRSEAVEPAEPETDGEQEPVASAEAAPAPVEDGPEVAAKPMAQPESVPEPESGLEPESEPQAEHRPMPATEPAVQSEPVPASPRPVPPLPRTMAIANQKGGVGKTTTAVNLGAALAEIGYRVLVVDLDPQGNATTGLGVNARNLEVSVYDVIMNDTPVDDCVEPTSVKNLFVCPATIDLAGAEIELVPAFSRELKLKRALQGARDD